MSPNSTVTHTIEDELPAAQGLAQLLFIQSTSVFERFGGIEYYLDDLQTDLAKLLGSNQIGALVPWRSRQRMDRNNEYQVYPVRYRHSGLLGKIENRFSPALWRSALQQVTISKPSFLVCGHIHLGPLVYLLSLRTGIPFITCTYGIEAWGDLGLMQTYALSKSHGLITISEWTKKMLIKQGYPAHQIQVVHPRLPTEFESLPPPPQKDFSRRPMRLLTVSRLNHEERYKGHDHVLQAMHKIAFTEGKLPFEYWIVGDGTDLPRLRSLAKTLNLGEAVQFFRPVESRRELINYYRECDIYVMPSRFGRWDGRWRGEGFGIVYLEAAACGLPSIAYNCGGATDIINHQSNGLLIEPDNTAELARELWKLHLHPSPLRHYAEQAYKDVMQRFTRRAVRKEILEWIRTLEPQVEPAE
jgi:phosphatidyl-myo-inositol dimannoside synthase